MRLESQIKNISLIGGTSNPKLQLELNQVKKDLNAILEEWQFGGQSFKSSEEFLKTMRPWVTKKLA